MQLFDYNVCLYTCWFIYIALLCLFSHCYAWHVFLQPNTGRENITCPLFHFVLLLDVSWYWHVLLSLMLILLLKINNESWSVIKCISLIFDLLSSHIILTNAFAECLKCCVCTPGENLSCIWAAWNKFFECELCFFDFETVKSSYELIFIRKCFQGKVHIRRHSYK